MDGNYYYHNYDLNYRHRKEQLFATYGNERSLDQRTNVNSVDFERCEKLAKKLPLSSEFRPAWDVSVLSKLGYDDIRILFTDSEDYTYQNGYGEMHTPVSFGLCARLPTSTVKFSKDEIPDELKNVQDAIDHGVDSICDVWKVLSNKDCVRLLLTLYKVDVDVSYAAEILNCSYALASHDLKMLADAGLVVSEKIDSRKVYSLKNRQVARDLYYLTIMVKNDHLTDSGN